MKRTVVIAAAIVLQTCLGGIYAWSVFAGALQSDYHLTPGQTNQVFATCVLVLTGSMIVTGRLQDRIGPRPVAAASGVFLAAGYLISGLSGGSYPALLLGWGLLVGLAIGSGYVCAIATAVKSFPRHKGLLTGLAVAGYGIGAILLSWVVNGLLAAGWDVMRIFLLLGIVYGGVVTLCGLTLSVPAPVSGPAPPQFRYRSLLTDGRFWRLAMGMFCATMPGLICVANLKQIGTSFGFDVWAATASVTAWSIGNTAGRIVFGFAYDRIGGRRAILFSLVGVVVSVPLVVVSGASPAVFLLAIVFASFNYGACFAIYAPRVAELWHPRVMGTIYALIFLAHGVTSQVASRITGWTVGDPPDFRAALWISGGITAGGTILYALASRSGRAAAPAASKETTRA